MGIYKLLKSDFTKEKNKIELFGCPNCNCNTLVIGVFHGDEPIGKDILENYLKNGTNKNLIIVPCLNPDGMTLNTRQNANKVDLNRNFPTKNWTKTNIGEDYYGGETPESETETKFIMQIIEEYKPKQIVTIHTPYKIVNFDGDEKAKKLAEKIAKILSYEIDDDIGYPTPGSFGTYYGKERNIPVITIELDENETLSELCQKFDRILSEL
ncbi:DUF2817 domain-containing protein [bacterium]|nr:DUF2817 domain-containing protein [bacterium]